LRSPVQNRSDLFRRAAAHTAAPLFALGFLIDASSVIRMGGGFVFALLYCPLLLGAWTATLLMRVR
jgi:hypothetical protein